MILEQLFHNMLLDGPPGKAGELLELIQSLRICVDKEENTRILLEDGNLAFVDSSHVGMQVLKLRVKDWPAIAIHIRPTEKSESRLVLMALPPDKVEHAGPFFCALLIALLQQLGMKCPAVKTKVLNAANN